MLTDIIGSGQYGRVYKAQHVKTGEIVAVKSISIAKISSLPKLREFTINEIENLGILTSPNIVKFIDKLQTSNNFYLVFEFCAHGTLENLLTKNKSLSEAESMDCQYQLTQGFKELNFKKIMHRDIKPSNILLDNNIFKIADFGFCKKQKNHFDMTKTIVGSPIYMAPEQLEGNYYGIKADQWSIGVLLYEMQYGYCPYEEKTIPLLLKLIKTKSQFFPGKISLFCENLMRKQLVINPSKRMTWDEYFNYMDQYKNIWNKQNHCDQSKSVQNLGEPPQLNVMENNSGVIRQGFANPTGNPMNPYNNFTNQNNPLDMNFNNVQTIQNRITITADGVMDNKLNLASEVISRNVTTAPTRKGTFEEGYSNQIPIPEENYNESQEVDIKPFDNLANPNHSQNQLFEVSYVYNDMENETELYDKNENNGKVLTNIDQNGYVVDPAFDEVQNTTDFNAPSTTNTNQYSDEAQKLVAQRKAAFFRQERHSTREGRTYNNEVYLEDPSFNRMTTPVSTSPNKINNFFQDSVKKAYDVKLDNRLDQKQDYYKSFEINNSNVSQNPVLDESLVNKYTNSDRVPKNYVQSTYNYTKQDNLTNGLLNSREKMDNYSRMNSVMMRYNLDKEKNKKDWMDKMSEYGLTKGIAGFPLNQLKQTQKDNRNKFGEEFIEIMLARFKMNHTVKIVLKMVQLLDCQKKKGHIVCEQKNKSIPKGCLSPIMEKKDGQIGMTEGSQSDLDTNRNNNQMTPKKNGHVTNNDIGQDSSQEYFEREDEYIFDEAEEQMLLKSEDEDEDKHEGSYGGYKNTYGQSRKDKAFGWRGIISISTPNLPDSEADVTAKHNHSQQTTGLLELWIFLLMKKARQYALSQKVKANFSEPRALGVYQTDINIQLDAIKSEIENFDQIFTFLLKELEIVTMPDKYRDLLPRDQIYQTKLPFDLDNYILRRNQLFAAKRLLKEKRIDFLDNAEYANDLLNIIMLDKYLHNLIDVKKIQDIKASEAGPKNDKLPEDNRNEVNTENGSSNLQTIETLNDITQGPDLALFDFEEGLSIRLLRKYVFVKLKVIKEEDYVG